MAYREVAEQAEVWSNRWDAERQAHVLHQEPGAATLLARYRAALESIRDGGHEASAARKAIAALECSWCGTTLSDDPMMRRCPDSPTGLHA